jgi:hypothetical protein
MKEERIMSPLLKTIDKVVFGFEELNEMEQKQEFIDCNHEEEFDVERSTN